MGAALACCSRCCDEDPLQPQHQNQHQQQHPPRHHQFSTPTQQPQPSSSLSYGQSPSSSSSAAPRCAVCGVPVDASLLEGHQESCRARHRRAMAEAAATEQQRRQRDVAVDSSPAVPLDSNHDDDPTNSSSSSIHHNSESVCIVCLERPKLLAFVPCGHVVGCLSCCAYLDSCPVCRTPRTALLRVDKDQVTRRFACKHCNNVISPSFFDAHQETCRLQQRQLQQQQFDGQTPSPPSRTKQLQEVLRLCADCHVPLDNKPADGEQGHLVAFLPCSHVLPLCRECSHRVTVCPNCMQPVTSRMDVFDT